jgi:hypothetical protein
MSERVLSVAVSAVCTAKNSMVALSAALERVLAVMRRAPALNPDTLTHHRILESNGLACTG